LNPDHLLHPNIEESMPNHTVMDELHVQVTAPRDRAAANLRTLRRYLVSRLFRRRLLQAVRNLFTHDAALKDVRIRIVH
jgi:hypothetical protein